VSDEHDTSIFRVKMLCYILHWFLPIPLQNFCIQYNKKDKQNTKMLKSEVKNKDVFHLGYKLYICNLFFWGGGYLPFSSPCPLTAYTNTLQQTLSYYIVISSFSFYSSVSFYSVNKCMYALVENMSSASCGSS
jgi:hypothetical protein